MAKKEQSREVIYGHLNLGMLLKQLYSVLWAEKNGKLETKIVKKLGGRIVLLRFLFK